MSIEIIKTVDQEIEMYKNQIDELEKDKKLTWKMIRKLQHLLYEQFERESDLMDQLNRLPSNIKVQIEESDQPVDQPIYESNYVPMAVILKHCKTKLQRQVATYFFDHRLDTYNSYSKTSERVYPGDQHGRQKVYSIVQTITKAQN